jgi:DNA-binding MarR family transcriptional regulator
MNYIERLSRISSDVMTLTGFFHGVVRVGSDLPPEARTNVARYHILKCLDRRGPHHLTQISATLNVKKNTLSELLDRMVRDGLVVRGLASDDRRKVILGVTPSGRVTMLEFEKLLMANMERFLMTLDEEDRRDLVGAIEALVRVLKKGRITPPGCFPA